MPRLLSIELERGKEGSAKGWLLAFCVYIGFLVRKHEIFDEVHTASRTEFHGIYTCPTAVPFAFALLNFLNFGLDMSLSLKLVRRGPNADGRWVRDDGSTNPSLSPPPAQCMPGPAPHCAAGRFAWRGGAQTCTKWARVCVRVSVCACVCVRRASRLGAHLARAIVRDAVHLADRVACLDSPDMRGWDGGAVWILFYFYCAGGGPSWRSRRWPG
jgi:hypothetical protein